MTKKKSQTITIRLLRNDKSPSDSVRAGVKLKAWEKLAGAQIALDKIGGGAPKWTKFLELPREQQDALSNSPSYGLVFVRKTERWFAVSFGMGHVQLDPDAYEQDFGLRVVLNTVHPNKLRSADVRTPDENTTFRRTQTARHCDQTAFSIDIERDIVHGLSGQPKDPNFASRVAGSDALTLTKKMHVADLPQVCTDAFTAFHKTDYQASFAWIDKIKHVRDKETIRSLDVALVKALNDSVKGAIQDTLHLAYPVIYDPEKARHIRYRGFRCYNVHTDLDIANYISDLREMALLLFEPAFLTNHKIHQVNAEGRDVGQSWRLRMCLIYETDLDGKKYVLSADRWYRVDSNLAAEVSTFFATIKTHDLPPARKGENEEIYNKRIAAGDYKMLCLDRMMVKPTGAFSPIEACDFLQIGGEMIHIKAQTSSSRLSHLFNQGTVSARVMRMDGAFRDRLRAQIREQQKTYGKFGYQKLVADSITRFYEKDHLIVYGVICSGTATGTKQLPFFSLVTFRQAAEELRALGYECAFAWIYERDSSTVTSQQKREAQPTSSVAICKQEANMWPASRKRKRLSKREFALPAPQPLWKLNARRVSNKKHKQISNMRLSPSMAIVRQKSEGELEIARRQSQSKVIAQLAFSGMKKLNRKSNVQLT